MHSASTISRVIVLAIMIAGVAYGSLYPFAFHAPPGGEGPLHALMATWGHHIERTDFFGNVIFYLPIGFFGYLAFSARFAAALRIMAAVSVGAVLSFGCEVAQYYDPGRVTSAYDLIANTLGTLIGALISTAFQREFRLEWTAELKRQRYATLLVAAWLGYRLYPFVPALDIHKYWDALKPLLLHPEVTVFGSFQYTVMWLAIAAITDRLAGPRRSSAILLFAAAAVLAAKLAIVGRTISADEVIGAAVSIALWQVMFRLSARRTAQVMSALLIAYIIAWRLEPFTFQPSTHQFGWVPFRSFLTGSIPVNALSFLEKTFNYGALIWFLEGAGLRLRSATALAVALLLLTSAAETYLPRSAESTDAMVALVMGLLAAAMRHDGGHEEMRVRSLRAPAMN